MDRKEFLKHACGLGVCGCALGAIGAGELLHASDVGAVPLPPAEAPDQRLAFARYQVAKLAGFMAADPAAPVCARLVEQTGRECAKLGRLGANFKGDPASYFEEAHKSFGTEFQWDKAKAVITVTVTEGECSCPLVDAKRTPAFWCNCSVGYQKETFENIFGRPVQVALKSSKLGGSKRCVFEVKLA